MVPGGSPSSLWQWTKFGTRRQPPWRDFVAVKSRRRGYSTIPRTTGRRPLAPTLPPPTLLASGPPPALGSGAGNSSLSGGHRLSPPGDAAGGRRFVGLGRIGGGRVCAGGR